MINKGFNYKILDGVLKTVTFLVYSQKNNQSSQLEKDAKTRLFMTVQIHITLIVF